MTGTRTVAGAAACTVAPSVVVEVVAVHRTLSSHKVRDMAARPVCPQTEEIPDSSMCLIYLHPLGAIASAQHLASIRSVHIMEQNLPNLSHHYEFFLAFVTVQIIRAQEQRLAEGQVVVWQLVAVQVQAHTASPPRAQGMEGHQDGR